MQLYPMLENFIFYISQMYEFSHSLGQHRRFRTICNSSALPPTTDMEADIDFGREVPIGDMPVDACVADKRARD